MVTQVAKAAEPLWEVAIYAGCLYIIGEPAVDCEDQMTRVLQAVLQALAISDQALRPKQRSTMKLEPVWKHTAQLEQNSKFTLL